MNQSLKLKMGLELVGWIATGLLAVLFIWPITGQVYNYPFLWINVLFIFCFVTFTRYLFLLKHTWLARLKWIKALGIILCIPMFLFILRKFKFFQEYLSEYGMEHFMLHLPNENQISLAKYVSAEMIFFGGGSLMVIILFAFRLLVSIWRQINKGTV